METLASIFVEPVVRYIIVPVGRQLGYLFFYKRNIKDLEKQLKNLEHIRERVQSSVDEQRSNSYEIYSDVLTWLEEVDVELLEMPQQNEGSNMSCFNCVQWHQFARKTKKRVVEQIPKLIDDGNKFDKENIGRRVPHHCTKYPTLPADYQSLQSRTLMAEQIKDALADPNVNKVGVCGMGGVGKTKLLDEVKKLVLENNLFHRVIVVTIGTSKSVQDVQDEIEGMLNMDLDANNKEVRTSRLQTKLVEMKDNILIMLDDLWKEYDLEREFGIPCCSKLRKKGCKILMTSRSRDLLTNQMNTDKWFEVNSLNEEESWKFFMAIVGEFVEGGIEKIAKNVVKKCGGLPIALGSLGKALKGKKVHVWKDAWKKLENHVFVGISGVNDQLYNCLKFSYDSLDDEAKRLFLLCSVFPDDHVIVVEDLQMYSMGMGLLNNDIKNWEDARNRVIKLVFDLKSSYLLLESNRGDDYVQMHDVVLDVTKYIASKIDKMSSLTYGHAQSEWREEDRCGSYNTIFVNCVDFPNLPPKLEFPNLELLILRYDERVNKKLIPDTFFEGMEKLRVLDMRYMSLDPSMSSLTHSSKNLQTLRMKCCECRNSINTIGQLKKLKILRINDCRIKELPESMSELTELKVLEVSFCSELEVIHGNIISSMKKLEELSLWGSFRKWGEEVSYKNKLIKNVRVSELDGLSRLSNLRLRILNVDMVVSELSLERAGKLNEFCISVGDYDVKCAGHYGQSGTRILGLNMNSRIDSTVGVIEILLQRCEQLYVKDSVGFTKALLKPIGTYRYPDLKRLHITIRQASDMPHQIIGNITPLFDAQVSFPELKDLTIEGENNLEMLWHYNNGLMENSFSKLQNIRIEWCNKLTYLFPSHMVTSLVFLNTLEVTNCKLLERIFEIEELIIDDVKVVASLTMLKLNFLPNLKYVWNNDPSELFTFPNLKKVDVEDCPQLKSLFPSSFLNHMKEIESLHAAAGENEVFVDDKASKFMSPEIVLFPCLRDLRLHCKVVEKRSFWVRSESFPQLQSLGLFGSKDDGMVTLPLEMSEVIYRIENFGIYNAFELVQVFQNGEENKHNQSGAKLKRLYLYDLPKLMYVWEDNSQMTTRFDSLETIDIYRCENLKCILLSSIVTFFNLTFLTVYRCNGMMNLFSSSVTKNLVNLKNMNVCHCGGMSSIIEVGGGEGEEEIIFNRMIKLELVDLPRLASFYSGKCTFEFPSLESLYIRECPEMKTFSYGIISTSKLPFMSIEEGGEVPISPTHGVNDIIQDFWKEEIVRSIKNLFTQEVF